MRINQPLDKILNNEAKVRALRIFYQNPSEVSGRQVAKMTGVSPKTAHEILQDLLREGVLVMRAVGKTHLFRLNEKRIVVRDVLRGLFLAESHLTDSLYQTIRSAVKESALKNNILSVAVFGSVHAKTEGPNSDVDLLVIIKSSDFRKRVEDFFSDLDQQLSESLGNLISPYINTLSEFKINAKKKTGVIPDVLKSYQLIYGDRLEKLLR